MFQGNVKKAVEAYQEAIEQRKQAVPLSPDLALAYRRLGDAESHQQQPKAAASAYQQAIDVLKGFDNQASSRKLLADTYRKLAQIYQVETDFEKALDTLQSAKEQLHTLDDTNQGGEYKLALADNYQQQGYLQQEFGHFGDALKAYLSALDVLERHVLLYHSDTASLEKLVVIHSQLGELYKIQGDIPNALSHYNGSIRILRDSTNNTSIRSNLAVAYEHLGNLYAQTGDHETSLQAYANEAEVAQTLLTKAPNDVRLLRILMISHYKRGQLNLRNQRRKIALGEYEKAIEYTARLVKISDTPQNQQDLKTLREIRDEIIRNHTRP